MRPYLRLSLAAACLACSLRAQALPLDLPHDLKKMLGDADGRSKFPLQPSEAPDNSLDSLRYLVGGGDGFTISIVGLPNQDYTPVVDPRGNIYVGDIGLIPLGKVPLARAQTIIADQVRKRLRKNYEVYVALNKVKTTNVTVSGVVGFPGTYQVTGNLRILDAIKQANGGALPPLTKADFRSVEVRNGDSVKTYDLLHFLSRQDMDENPYVYPGDNISVSPQDARIFVAGEVLDPVRGSIPLKPGETIGDVLKVVRVRRTADSVTVLLQKASEAEPRRYALAQAQGVALENNDILTIQSRAASPRPDTIVVTGEVAHPGLYAVPAGQADLEALIRMAGAATGIADPQRAFVLRHRKQDEIQGVLGQSDPNSPANPLRAAMPSLSLQTVRPEVASSVADLKASGDFIVIQGEEARKPGVIQDGDQIHVPRKEIFVYVSGSVRKPGAYRYEAGASLGKYIDLAGGYSDKADPRNQYILADYHDVLQIRGGETPSPGDVIVVPAGVEYKRFTTLFLPTLQVITSILSVLLTVVVVYKQK